MPGIEIIGTGWVDRRDSAFPPGGTAAQWGISSARSAWVVARSFMAAPTGRVLPTAGETWTVEGTILASTDDPRTTAGLETITGGRMGRPSLPTAPAAIPLPARGSGTFANEPVLCRSTDGGRTWSSPSVVPDAGRLPPGDFPWCAAARLGPAARAGGDTARPKIGSGEQVLVAISDDGGHTWPHHAIVFADPQTTLRLFRAEAGRTRTRPPDRDGLGP